MVKFWQLQLFTVNEITVWEMSCLPAAGLAVPILHTAGERFALLEGSGSTFPCEREAKTLLDGGGITSGLVDHPDPDKLTANQSNIQRTENTSSMWCSGACANRY